MDDTLRNEYDGLTDIDHEFGCDEFKPLVGDRLIISNGVHTIGTLPSSVIDKDMRFCYYCAQSRLSTCDAGIVSEPSMDELDISYVQVYPYGGPRPDCVIESWELWIVDRA